MTKITKEEIRKIAAISSLDIRDDELEGLLHHLQEVLSYAERVTEVAADVHEPSTKNVNFFREDVVVKTDPELLLSRAPEREGDYFVVPAILDNKKKA